MNAFAESTNRALWRSVHSLTHPVSILAVLVLLFNDHYLRHVSPSWMTGKLGDFTWLLFAPFVAGLLFAFVIPRRVRNHEQVVGLVSIGFIGVWFATAKTIPAVHHITTEALAWLVGWEGQLRLDVTDLLTLPALLISWHIWRNVPDTQINLKPYAPIIFSLALLGTLASDVNVPSQGIVCIREESGVIYAQPSDSANQYISIDGGITWRRAGNGSSCHNRQNHTTSWQISRPDDNMAYHFSPGNRVYITHQNDGTVVASYDLPHNNASLREIYRRRNGQYVEYQISPVNAVVHSETGNVVMAMSLDGVLVITPDGEQIWADVGGFHYMELTKTDLFTLIDGAFLLGLFLFLLVGSTFLAPSAHSQPFLFHYTNIPMLIVIIGWFIWFIIDVLYYPAWNFLNVSDDLTKLFFGLILLTSLIFVALFIYQFRKQRTVILPAVLLTSAITLVFMLPYILWIENRIPNFDLAKLLAVSSALMSTVIANQRIRNRYFPEPSESEIVYEQRDIDPKTPQIDRTIDPFESE